MADLEADLTSHPGDPAAKRWRANAAAYPRVLAGLEAGAIVPAEVRCLVREWAEANDREVQYDRVIFEHEALHALRFQLDGGRQ